MTIEQWMADVLRERDPEIQQEYLRNAREFQAKARFAIAVGVISGAAALWFAPLWAKFLIPLAWSLFYILTQQIAAGFVTHLVMRLPSAIE